MCGIFGLIKLKNFDYKRNNEIAHKTLERIASASQSRGSDASGFGCIVDKKLQVFKDHEPIKDLLLTNKFKNFNGRYLKKAKIIIGHTRAKTRGEPKNNKNNHPVMNGDNTAAVIHNGSIYNYDNLVKDEKLKLKAEVDTEAIISLYDKYNKLFPDFIPKLRGSFAIAIIDEEFPNKINFFRHSSPIIFGFCEEWNCIFFASEQTFIEKAVREYRHLIFDKNIAEIDYSSASNDTMYSFNLNNPETVDFKLEIEIPITNYSSRRVVRYDNQAQRARKAFDGSKLPIPRNESEGITELFGGSKLNPRGSSDEISICKNMYQTAGQFIIEEATPYFFFELKKRFKEWRNLIDRDSISFHFNQNLSTNITFTINPKLSNKMDKKRKLRKLLIKFEHKLLIRKNIKERMAHARRNMHDYLDNVEDKQVENFKNQEMTDYLNNMVISPLIPESIAKDIRPQNKGSIEEYYSRESEIQELFKSLDSDSENVNKQIAEFVNEKPNYIG